MSERRPNDPAGRDEENRNDGGKTREERDASTEAVEEEEQTGGPRREGDG